MKLSGSLGRERKLLNKSFVPSDSFSLWFNPSNLPTGTFLVHLGTFVGEENPIVLGSNAVF